MIKANELRIGSWVNRNGEPLCIEHDDITDAYFSPEAYDPMPITPVLLLKLGFSIGKHYYFKEWGNNGVFIVRWDMHYKMFMIEAGKGFNICVDYVHSLQNAFLVFSLGEELEMSSS